MSKTLSGACAHSPQLLECMASPTIRAACRGSSTSAPPPVSTLAIANPPIHHSLIEPTGGRLAPMLTTCDHWTLQWHDGRCRSQTTAPTRRSSRVCPLAMHAAMTSRVSCHTVTTCCRRLCHQTQCNPHNHWVRRCKQDLPWAKFKTMSINCTHALLQCIRAPHDAPLRTV